MRFRVGLPEPTHDFAPEQTGWSRVDEPEASPRLAAAGSAIGLLLSGLAVWAWRLAPSQQLTLAAPSGGWTPGRIALLLLAPLLMIPALIVVHEVVHLVAYPGRLGRDATLGILPRSALAYAHFAGEHSVARLLVVLAAPFLVLSFLPWALAVGLRLHAPGLEGLSVANALGCGGDAMGIALLLRIPRAAVLRNQGWETWFRVRE